MSGRGLNVRLALGSLVLVALIPVAVFAADTVGNFVSSTTTPAVTATNTDGGNALNATSSGGIGVAANGSYLGVSGQGNGISGTGVEGQTFFGSGMGVAGIARGYPYTSTGYGVYGEVQSDSSGTGVFGYASSDSGTTYGVVGQNNSPAGYGVYGSGPKWAVYGWTPQIGNLSYGLYSATDAGVVGHLVAKNGNVAGVCNVAAITTSRTCSFPQAFASGTIPVVVVSPLASNPGTNWWVASTTTTGFTLNLAIPQSTVKKFTYIVVGVLPGL